MARSEEVVKFSSRKKTGFATKEIKLPKIGYQCLIAKELPEEECMELKIRTLCPVEMLQIESEALLLYKQHFEAEPTSENPFLGYCRQIVTLSKVCLDTETDEPFFESADELIQEKDITPEHIAYLYITWQAFCAEYDPRYKSSELKDIYNIVEAISESKETELAFFLSRLQPTTLKQLVHFMAKALTKSQFLKFTNSFH